MKKCPFCSEEIQDDAIKCKHCGEFLHETIQAALPENKIKWYFSKSFIVIAICCVGPLALPLIWWRPQTSRAWKTGLTIGILALTWVLLKATQKSMDTIREYYQLMEGF